MPNRRILTTWIGHHDLLAAAAVGDDKLQEKVLSQLKIKRPLPLSQQTGPVKTLLSQQSFDEIHLLGDYPKWLRTLYTDWLGQDVTMHAPKLKDPTDYGEILTAVKSVLDKFTRTPDTEFSFLLTPGTPSMAATWILLGKSQYDAVFWQTYKDKVKESVIPFDVVAGFAPDLAIVPDENLQHLATKSPSELDGFAKISGSSKALKLAAGRAAKAATRDVPVLILGEPGTGKELFAKAIHDASTRKEKPFIPVNCAAIPESLLEAQLFGYVAGAFSDANKKGKTGIFEQADGGTVFLDEVGECSPVMQAALLRVLQPPKGKGPCYREFSPVGDFAETRSSDVRIISATNRDLTREVDEGTFREDLFYRLAVIKVKIPTLRSRKSDIPELVEDLMKDINKDFRSKEKGYKDKSISDAAKRFVRSYDWPGNIRQLQNSLVEAAIMSEGDSIGVVDVKSAIADMPGKSAGLFDQELGEGFCLQKLLEAVNRKYLERAMEEADGVKTKAADLLGMSSYQTLDAQLKRLKVKVAKSK
ncbi:sigma 54-interacting transcriptional regulator [Mariniblastus sp.]|nr:sigma 54-interacting transcriptional regulator [Mariniblastus sp.]